MFGQPTLLSIPDELLADIGSWLNDKEVCQLELASKSTYKVLSRPSHLGPCKRRLTLHGCFGRRLYHLKKSRSPLRTS